jgi:hypothetical protein
MRLLLRHAETKSHAACGSVLLSFVRVFLIAVGDPSCGCVDHAQHCCKQTRQELHPGTVWKLLLQVSGSTDVTPMLIDSQERSAGTTGKCSGEPVCGLLQTGSTVVTYDCWRSEARRWAVLTRQQ